MFVRHETLTIRVDERRVTCRYPADQSPVEVGWWIGEEFRSLDVTLRDISLTGVSVLTKSTPPDIASLWLRLKDPAQPNWIEARVISVISRFWRPTLIRMQFLDPCPYDFFAAAIRGLVPPDKAEGANGDGRRGKFWGGLYWD